MKNWKVVVNINDNKEQKTIFVKDVETMEEAYCKAKRYFLVEKSEIDFCGVEKATEV